MVETLTVTSSETPPRPTYPGNRNLLRDFFNSGGLARLVNKFMVKPAYRLVTAEIPQTPQLILGIFPRLQTAIEKAVDPNDLVCDVSYINQIPMPQRELWGRFVGALREGLYEQHLLSGERFSSAHMVTSDQIAAQIATGGNRTTLTSDGFHFKDNPKVNFGLANAYAVRMGDSSILVDPIFLFNRKWEGLVKNDRAIERVKLGINDIDAQKLLAQSLVRSSGLVIDSALAVHIHRSFFFVTEHTLDFPDEEEAKKLYKGVIKVPLGNPRDLAYTALRSINRALAVNGK